MNKQSARRIIYAVIFIVILVTKLCFVVDDYKENKAEKEEYMALYAKEHLTVEDINTESSYSYSTATTPGDEGEVPPEEVEYKKLYGVEHIGQYEIDKNGGIEVTVFHGDNVKLLILDEEGKERFYREITEATFEPGETGDYDVYLVGNKFTGRVAFSIY